jgi:hypothetical protein
MSVSWMPYSPSRSNRRRRRRRGEGEEKVMMIYST